MNNQSQTIKNLAILIARDMIADEEGVALHAYPDPMSPLGKALTKEFGAKGILRIASGSKIPAHLEHLKGDPWTIGYGATGSDIKKGMVWTKGQSKDRLSKDLERYYRLALNAWPGMDRLHELAQAALIDTAYNRGTDMRKNKDDPLDRRLEIRELVNAVANKDYLAMSALFTSMTRLWENQNLGGLVARCKRRARMCLDAHELVT